MEQVARHFNLPSGSSLPETDLYASALEAEHRWSDAINTSDWAAIEAFLMEEFRYSFGGRRKLNREEFLKMIHAGLWRTSLMETEDLEIRIFDNLVAIAMATVSIDGVYLDVPFKGRCRAMRIWFRRNGQWQLSTLQGSDASVDLAWESLQAKKLADAISQAPPPSTL